MGISREEALCVYVLAGLLIVGSVMLMWSHRADRKPVAAGSSTPESPGAAVPGAPGSSGSQQGVDSQAGVPAPSTAGEALVVHVSGAVKSPGVYRLRKGDRVADAVQAAGGPGPGAVVDAINLASKLEDGQKVYVPSKSDLQQGGSGGAGGVAGRTGGAQWGTPPKVNLNTATGEQLDTLPGIGPGLAAAIIEYRQRTGGFRKTEDLMKVGGIGQKTYDRLKNLVTVD
ncbi:MAG: helix-hairpin-helix domain-containing protein [Ignavibacteriales bacterium]